MGGVAALASARRDDSELRAAAKDAVGNLDEVPEERAVTIGDVIDRSDEREARLQLAKSDPAYLPAFAKRLEQPDLFRWPMSTSTRSGCSASGPRRDKNGARPSIPPGKRGGRARCAVEEQQESPLWEWPGWMGRFCPSMAPPRNTSG